jgi:formylglycine-generating enzyme required for sulfatase activity
MALTLMIAVAGLLILLPGSSHAHQDRQLVQNAPTTANNSKRLALVIGNGAYTSAPPLKNPPNDARDMAASLKALGFDVTSGINVNQRDMKRLIREFGQKLKAGGSGLFYYAGHGVQSKGRNYLIPVDAEIQSEAEVEDSGVDVSLVLNFMDDAQNGLNIVILDACRNNPFSRSFRSASNGLAQVDAPTGTLIAYATAPGRVASDGTGQNGLYTSELLKQMQVPALSATDLFMRVRAEVMKQTDNKQVPWEASSLVGSFYFAAGPRNTAGTPTSASANETKINPVAVEREYWETVRSSNDPQDYKDYLQAYPNGAYAGVARAKLRQLDTAKNTRPSNSQPTNPPPTGTANTSASRPKSFKSQQGIEMVYIPPGRFMMGSNNSDGEKPVHEVTISQAFYMGKYEVTQAQWQAVMGNNPSNFRGANLPVEQVSWNDAIAFIARLNAQNDEYTYRLPTEAEWEYACRAGTDGDYAGDLEAMAWYGNNSGRRQLNAAEIMQTDSTNYQKRITENGGQTHAVGNKLPNSFGLFDMHGNVWEWCQDWYHPNYDGAPSDGSAWLSGGEQKFRVLRAGSWQDNAGLLRSAYRYGIVPNFGLNSGLGFRVVAVLRSQ